MSAQEMVLTVGAAIAVVLWAVLSLLVLAVVRRRARARATLDAAVAAIESTPSGSVDDRLARARPALAGASRELVMAAVTNDRFARPTRDILTAFFLERWSVATLERDAASHNTKREKWRRIAALRILSSLAHPQRTTLLADAVRDVDSDVAATALALLGDSDDLDAVDVLVDALRNRQQLASHVAAHLDRSPQHLGARLQPLLGDEDAVVRRWAARLVGRYPDVEGLDRDLAALAGDPDARVRAAAVESLGQIGGATAGATAERLLTDPAPFVRAAALRSIGALDRDDLADSVASLLGDRDWWVRLAAKQCLERMGAEIWPVLVRRLDDPDRFVRNGAAEVFQNLGVLDSFIVMEAASGDTGHGKLDLLRRIAAAGGLRLTDSLMERCGPALAPRIRQLLTTVGLEHVGTV